MDGRPVKAGRWRATNRGSRIALGAGVALGLVLAVAGALAPAESSKLPGGAVVVVNGREIHYSGTKRRAPLLAPHA